jgi:hypothetical protein
MSDPLAEFERIKAEVVELLQSLPRLRAEGQISGLQYLKFESQLKEMLGDLRKHVKLESQLKEMLAGLRNLMPGPVEWERGKRNHSYGQFESNKRRH